MFEGKTILITGGTGTVGQALTKRLLAQNPKEIRILSRNEHKQQEMKRAFKSPVLKFVLGSVEDVAILERVVSNCEFIFHFAAMKYADVAEKQPIQTIQSNLVGTINVVNMAMKHAVGHVIAASSDKAVNPVYMYGMSKRMLEYIFAEANDMFYYPKFYVARFGNVFGSTGSVADIWTKANKKGKKLTVTNKDMTRFYWTADEAIDLMFAALIHGDHNGIYIPVMKTVKTIDLAKAMQEHGIEIVGSRPGEKLHESIATAEEMTNTIQMAVNVGGKMVKFGLIQNERATDEDMQEYSSEISPRMTKTEIRAMINQYKESL